MVFNTIGLRTTGVIPYLYDFTNDHAQEEAMLVHILYLHKKAIATALDMRVLKIHSLIVYTALSCLDLTKAC